MLSCMWKITCKIVNGRANRDLVATTGLLFSFPCAVETTCKICKPLQSSHPAGDTRAFVLQREGISISAT